MKNEKLKDPKRKKKLLLLPLLVIPFLTMAFWALSGGKNSVSTSQKRATGLNLQLPNAQLKDDRGENKLSYYEQAEKDSAKWRRGAENDSFFQSSIGELSAGNGLAFAPYPSLSENYRDPNEEKVYQKLAELNSQLKNPEGKKKDGRVKDSKHVSDFNSPTNSVDIDRLQEMIKNPGAAPARDPEVEQLNQMMDRILDIQHPERVKQRINENLTKTGRQVFAAKAKKDHYSISLLDTSGSDPEISVFFSTDDLSGKDEQNAIEAVIHETQNLVSGSIVKIRLLDDVMVSGVVIPKGSFVFGKTSLEGERLHIEISSIRKDNSLYPVKLVVYDLDGMEGIHIPGTITRESLKQSADNSLGSLEMSSIDPSLKVQAATAGINAAKTLLSRRTKLVKVTLKAGYKILLKQSNQ